jgi:hypothetical protein
VVQQTSVKETLDRRETATRHLKSIDFLIARYQLISYQRVARFLGQKTSIRLVAVFRSTARGAIKSRAPSDGRRRALRNSHQTFRVRAE